MRRPWRLEVALCEDEILVVECGPKLRALGKCEQRNVNDERGKIIERGGKMLRFPRGVLVMLVAQLRGLPASHGRHEHSIQVDRPDVAVLDNDVSVLKISVGNASRSQRANRLQPQLGEKFQDVGAPKDFRHVDVLKFLAELWLKT